MPTGLISAFSLCKPISLLFGAMSLDPVLAPTTTDSVLVTARTNRSDCAVTNSRKLVLSPQTHDSKTCECRIATYWLAMLPFDWKVAGSHRKNGRIKSRWGIHQCLPHLCEPTVVPSGEIMTSVATTVLPSCHSTRQHLDLNVDLWIGSAWAERILFKINELKELKENISGEIF